MRRNFITDSSSSNFSIDPIDLKLEVGENGRAAAFSVELLVTNHFSLTDDEAPVFTMVQ